MGLKCPTVRNVKRIQIPFFVADEAILHLHELLWRRDEGLNGERTPPHCCFILRQNSFQTKGIVAVVFIVILGLFALFWLAFTSYKWRQFVCECSVNVSLDTATKRVRMLDRFRSFKELLLVIPAWAWVKFGEERTEHRSTLFGTDIDVIQLENFLIEFVPMEKSEGWIELL